ncbi:MAG: hypothetical protein ACXWC4_15240 [Telluria sp.]
MDDSLEYEALVKMLKEAGAPTLHAVSEASALSSLNRKLESEVYRLRLGEKNHEFQINVLSVMVLAELFLLMFLLSLA